MLRTYINGNTVPEPKGFDDLQERLFYSKELSGYVTAIVGGVTFTGYGYNLLRELLNDGICSEVIFSAEDNMGSLFTAKIFLTDVKWNLTKREAEAELTYDGWLSKVDHNKKIQAVTNIGRSKNDVPITVNPQTNFIVPDADNNPINDNTGKRGIYLYDAFLMLVEFMTDGEVSFRSDYLNYNVANPEEASLCWICTGKALRENSFATFPAISFKELFDDVNRLFNLAFTYEEDNTGKYVRIEPKKYFKGQNISANLPDVKGVIQSLDEDSFPAKVRFGSAEQADDDTYLTEFRFLSLWEEEYHLAGQCNLDTVLDLQLTTLVSDPNIIQDIVPTGTHTDRDYDKTIFIIANDPADISRAKMTEDPANLGFYYVNDFLNNEKVALRWFDQIPLSIYAFLGGGNNGCYVGVNADLIMAGEVLPLLNSHVFRPQNDSTSGFNNVNGNYGIYGDGAPPNYVPSGNYPSGTFAPYWGGWYTAPFSFIYNFEAQFLFQNTTWRRIWCVVIEPVNQVIYAELLASQYSIDPPELQVGNVLSPHQNPNNVSVAGTVYMTANSQLAILVDSPVPSIIYGGTLEVFDPFAGRWATFNEEDNFLLKNEFQYPIAREKWETIKGSPNDGITFDINDGTVRTGWLSQIIRTIKTGKTEITLNSKI